MLLECPDLEQSVSVLSVQTPALGHGTYGRLLRQHFDRTNCQVDSAWLDEDKEMRARVFWRLVTQSLPGRWAAENNIDMRRFRHEIGIGYIGRRAAVRHLKKKPYNVLHFHTQVSALLSLDLMRRVPTVITGDATAALIAKQPGIPGRQWTHAPSLRADRQVFQAAAKVVMWSEWAARSVVEDYGIHQDKVDVVYPGVDLSRFPVANPRVRDAAAPINLLFVGGDFERKGGQDVLAVFLEQFAHTAELHLVTEAAVDCAHPRVHFHQGIKAYSEEWLDLYRCADVFVLPTHSEAFGLVFTEAMAMSLPVIATNINAIPEIVAHGKTGFLITPGNRQALVESIGALVSNPTLRQQMGQAGRETVEAKFDAQANFQNLATLFRAAVRPTPRVC